MKALGRILCFFLAFMLEVKVKAVDISSSEDDEKIQALFQEPHNCINSIDQDCYLSSDIKNFELKLISGKVSAVKNSIVKRIGDNTVQLVKGAILVEAQEKTKVKTIGGSANLVAGSRVLVVKKSDKFYFYPLVNQVSLQPLRGESMLIPVGFSNWVGSINIKGKSEVGIPHSANFPTVVLYWGKLTQLSYSEFRNPLEIYRTEWSLAVERSSRIHSAMVGRRIASEKERREARRRARLRRIQQQKSIEAFYKSKNHYY